MGKSEDNTIQRLMFLQKTGSIDMDDVASIMSKLEEQRIMEIHPYGIFECGGRWITHIKDETRKEGRRKLTRGTREKLIEALIKHYAEMDKSTQQLNCTLKELYPQWLEFKAVHTAADNYIERLDRAWKSYYEGTDIINVPIRELTKVQLDEWVHRVIKEHDMTNKQYYNFSVIIRQVLDYAVDIGIVGVNVFRSVRIAQGILKHVKKKTSDTQVFTDEERKAIEEIAWNSFKNPVGSRKHKLAPLAVLFQFQTGIRVGEALSLRYEDISADGERIHIQRTFRYETGEIVEHTKGKEGERFIPLTEHAKEIIKAAKDKQKECGFPDDGYIFSVDDRPLPYQPIQYLYEQYCNKLGITQKSSHKSRKTFVSKLYTAGMHIDTIRAIVGHVDESTTFHCYCFDQSDVKEQKELLDTALSVK